MSVIIKGKKMPGSCSGCELMMLSGDYVICKKTNSHSSVEKGMSERMIDCPLIEIPLPHGKIIDADAEIKRYGLDKATKYGNETEDELNFSYSQMMMYEIAGLFENATTILDAEGEE